MMAKPIPYEKNHELPSIKLVTSIVNKGQANFVVDRLKEAESAIMLISHGSGTSSSDFYEALGGDSSKQIIFAIIRDDKWPKLKADLLHRFKVSPFSRGLAFKSPIASIFGVSTYKMVTNNTQPDRTIKKKSEEKPMEEKEKSEYLGIYAIVNNGYTDLVMDAARSAGAKGGTIISARGTGNKEIEKFFGVVITPEKEIVLIIVKRELCDQVLSAINKEAGIYSKGQGIAFAVPVEEVVGIFDGKATE